MDQKLLQILHIACSHHHTSKPFAAAVGNSNSSGDWEAVGNGPGHYVVCLDCGKKFAYDWANMQIITR